MRTVYVAENAVSIWFSRETLPSRRQVMALVRQTLTAKGYAPWPETEAECFAAGDDALVIARPGKARRRAFFFADLEDLLAGAGCCAGSGGALYLHDGGYILTVAAKDARAGLYEFGRRLRLPPGWETMAREHGICILAENAVGGLRRHFTP